MTHGTIGIHLAGRAQIALANVITADHPGFTGNFAAANLIQLSLALAILATLAGGTFVYLAIAVVVLAITDLGQAWILLRIIIITVRPIAVLADAITIFVIVSCTDARSITTIAIFIFPIATDISGSRVHIGIGLVAICINTSTAHTITVFVGVITGTGLVTAFAVLVDTVTADFGRPGINNNV